MIRTFIPVLTLALSLTACKGDDDDVTETGKALQGTPSEIQGRWKSACLASSVLEANFTQREYVFNAIGDFDKLERYYSDEACTNLLAEHKVIGTVEAKGKAPEAQDPEAEMLNFTVNDASLKVVSGDILDFLNGVKACGKSDWQVGAEVPILKMDCLGYELNKGDVIFDLYDVKEEQLYLGETFLFLAETDANARPNELETDIAFAKQ